MTSPVSYELVDDIGVISIDNPPVNALSHAVRQGIHDALAAAQQGKYAAFYEAMFASGSVTPDTIDDAARTAGLDIAAARAFAQSDAVTAELARNRDLARSLGFTGTPAWVTGDRIVEGAVGYDGLAEAIADES